MNVYDDGEHWDATPDIDPMQVAQRLHELRHTVEELTGTDAAEWYELSDDEQELATAIATAVIDHFRSTPAGSALAMAEQIHTVRRYLGQLVGDDTIPPWADLSDDRRDILAAVCTEVIEWLKREGPR